MLGTRKPTYAQAWQKYASQDNSGMSPYVQPDITVASASVETVDREKPYRGADFLYTVVLDAKSKPRQHCAGHCQLHLYDVSIK